MKKAYNKDIWRAIWKGKKRFFSIMLITTLGVAMFSALKVACVDLKQSADGFLDEQNLFDIQVVSTLGMTDEDVKALQALEEVELAEGAYSESANIRIGEKNRSVSLKTLSESGMNQPYLLEGKLPQKADEIAVTSGFFDREVHLYVNKETMILTGVGILCGIPLGYAFAQTLTVILRIPSMYLAVSLHLESYLMAAGMSFVFALIVNVITNRSLDVIDPVEALKSIE